MWPLGTWWRERRRCSGCALEVLAGPVFATNSNLALGGSLRSDRVAISRLGQSLVTIDTVRCAQKISDKTKDL